MYEIVNVVYGIQITNKMAKRMNAHVNARTSTDSRLERYTDEGEPVDFEPDWWCEILPGLEQKYHGGMDEVPVFIGVNMDEWACHEVKPASTVNLIPTDEHRSQFEDKMRALRSAFPEFEDFDFGTPDVAYYGSSS